MKSKIRLWWILSHAYLACFFLPITLLYATTGALYLLDIKGGVKEHFEYSIALNNDWPETSEDAERLIKPMLDAQDHPLLPDAYYPDGDSHSWYGFKQEVILSPMQQHSRAQLIIKEHDLWHQFLLIHKGHAGKIFWLFGILLGMSLIFSLVSGVVLALNIPKFKNNSIIAMLLGLAAIVFSYIVS